MTANAIAGSTGLIASSSAIALKFADGDWVGPLRLLSACGFDFVDLSDFWIALAGLDNSGLDRLRDAMAASGLVAVGASVVGAELHRTDRRDESLVWVRKALKNAAQLNLPHVSLGFQPKPGAGGIPGARPGWADGDGPPDYSAEQFASAAADLRALAEEAADLGIGISIEMHERMMSNSAAAVLRLLDMAGHDNLGANPDLGNLIRCPWPLAETWYQTLELLAPHTTYWHIKNVTRIELAQGQAAAAVADLDAGTIDYRAALALTERAGYRGPLVVEHHASGDPFAVASRARAYLAGLQTLNT